MMRCMISEVPSKIFVKWVSRQKRATLERRVAGTTEELQRLAGDALRHLERHSGGSTTVP